LQDVPRGAPSRNGRGATWIILAAILATGFFLTLRDLGHPCLTYFDESFHAVVARNLLKHPLTPTLLDHPYRPVDPRNWEETHIWLHKGIVPLWIIAGSYKLLGVDVFALRLPSLLLNTAAIWLTFEIGRRLMDRRAGLIAAALQALSPCFGFLVRGRSFSDHVDITLLFWLEAAFLFLTIGLQSGRWRWFIFAGVAQGLAFLTKSFVGILPGAALLLMLVLRMTGLRPLYAWKALLIVMGVTVATAAPWTIWCMVKFPAEFWHELWHVGQHLQADVEGWAAPWYRIYLKYAPVLFGGFYTPVIVALLISIGRVIWRRVEGLALPVAWAVVVLSVFTLATAKPPMATMIAMPAMYLLLAGMISRALCGEAVELFAWIAIVAACLIDSGRSARGAEVPTDFLTAARQEMWVFRQLGVGLAAALLGAWYSRTRSRMGLSATRAAEFATVISAALLWPMLKEDWKAGEGDPNEPTYTEIGEYVQTKLPANAVMLVDRAYDGEHRIMQFYTDRTCYPASNDFLSVAEEIRRNGGEPMLFSYRIWNLPVIYTSPHDQRTIYQCPPPGVGPEPRPIAKPVTPATRER